MAGTKMLAPLFGIVLALASLIMAQSSATLSAPPSVHTVNVGLGNFKYEPNETFANPGDIITFNFYPTNHSVVRAAYGLPCIPYELTGADLTGFASPNFLTQTLNDPPQWNLTVNDTEPVFYYCTAIDSCKVQGMVGVINPNASVSLSDQLNQALEAPYMLTPGQAFPDEGAETRPHLTANPSLLTAKPTGDATATATATISASSSSATSSNTSGAHLSGGAIAGIVIAAVAFVGLLAGFFWLLGHRRGLMGSSAAGQSLMGNNKNKERTQEWANANSGAPWGGSSDAAARGDMSERGNMGSPLPSPGYMNSSSTPVIGQQSQPSESTQFIQQQPQRQTFTQSMELGGNEITELEAPHALKY